MVRHRIEPPSACCEAAIFWPIGSQVHHVKRLLPFSDIEQFSRSLLKKGFDFAAPNMAVPRSLMLL
jgi:hypothetical protein